MVAGYGKMKKFLEKTSYNLHTANKEELLGLIENETLIENNVSTIVITGSELAVAGTDGNVLRNAISSLSEKVPILVVAENEKIMSGKEPANNNVKIFIEKSKRPEVLESLLDNHLVHDVKDLSTGRLDLFGSIEETTEVVEEEVIPLEDMVEPVQEDIAEEPIVLEKVQNDIVEEPVVQNKPKQKVAPKPKKKESKSSNLSSLMQEMQKSVAEEIEDNQSKESTKRLNFESFSMPQSTQSSVDDLFVQEAVIAQEPVIAQEAVIAQEPVIAQEFVQEPLQQEFVQEPYQEPVQESYQEFQQESLQQGVVPDIRDQLPPQRVLEIVKNIPTPLYDYELVTLPNYQPLVFNKPSDVLRHLSHKWS